MEVSFYPVRGISNVVTLENMSNKVEGIRSTVSNCTLLSYVPSAPGLSMILFFFLLYCYFLLFLLFIFISWDKEKIVGDFVLRDKSILAVK